LKSSVYLGIEAETATKVPEYTLMSKENSPVKEAAGGGEPDL
jgi:hypothetical protein